MQKTISYENAFDLTESTVNSDTKVTFEYVPSLDGVRAIAVLVVVFFHATLVFPQFRYYFQGGFLGVDIFFVLSGFLITSILLKEFDQTENISLKNFYARRFLRLTPAYWFHLLIIFIFAYQIFPKIEVDKLFDNNTFVYSLLYLTNWQRALGSPDAAGLLGHTWSLAIEEQFYLFWSLALLLMLRKMSRKTVAITTFSLILLTLIFRAWRYTNSESYNFLYNSFDSRMDALLIGCLFSQIVAWRLIPQKFYESQWFDLLSLIALFITVAIFFNVYDSYKTPFLYQGGLTIFAFAVGVLIVWIVTHKTNKLNGLLQFSPLIWLGKTSYGIYLWHSAAIAFANEFDWSPIVKLLIALTLTLAITAFSYYAIELPFLRRKEFFKTA